MNYFEFLYLTATDENTTYYNFKGEVITKEEFEKLSETKDKNRI
jgi:hypothetical protein